MSTELIVILIVTAALFGLPIWSQIAQRGRGSKHSTDSDSPIVPGDGPAGSVSDSKSRNKNRSK